MRDPAFYERDTLVPIVSKVRGSASMLFGRGSTGGVVNQVSKEPDLIDRHEDRHRGRRALRAAGGFQPQDRERFGTAAEYDVDRLRTFGTGAGLDKKGTGAWRYGAGSSDEFTFSGFHLDNHSLGSITACPGWYQHRG